MQDAGRTLFQAAAPVVPLHHAFVEIGQPGDAVLPVADIQAQAPLYDLLLEARVVSDQQFLGFLGRETQKLRQPPLVHVRRVDVVDRHIDRVLQVAAKGEAGPCQLLAEGIDEIRLAGGGQAKVLKHVLVVAFSVETDSRASLEAVLQRLHSLLGEPVGVDQGLSGQVRLEVFIEGAAAHLVKDLADS